ncbi:hypothetical protein LINGRAHAP2_LOCUS8829 [Linum grandiflorum]
MGGQSISTRLLLLQSSLVVAIMCSGVTSIVDTYCDGLSDNVARCSGSKLPGNAEYAQQTIIDNLKDAMDSKNNPIACYKVSYSGEPGGSVYYADAYFSCNELHKDCLKCLSDAINVVTSLCDGAAGAAYAMENCCLRYESEFSFCKV